MIWYKDKNIEVNKKYLKSYSEDNITTEYTLNHNKHMTQTYRRHSSRF